MNKSVFSNVNASAQSIFKGAKKLFVEEDLGVNSVKSAVDKVSKKNIGKYSNYLNALKENDQEGYEAAKKLTDKALKTKPENLKAFGKEMSKDTSEAIKMASAGKMTMNNYSLEPKDLEGAYNKMIRKTKGAIGMSAAGNVATGYYYNPLKQGFANQKSGMKFRDNKELHKAGARIGATLAVGGLTMSSSNDEELKYIQRQLRQKYDEGDL